MAETGKILALIQGALQSVKNDLSATGLKEFSDSETMSEVLDLTWESGYVINGQIYSSESYVYTSIPVKEGDSVISNSESTAAFRFIDLMNGDSVSEMMTDKGTINIPANVDRVVVSVSNTWYSKANFFVGKITTEETIDSHLDIVENDYEEETEKTFYNDNEIEWTTGVLHSNGTIYTGGSFDNNHYAFFDVAEGDVIASENNDVLRDVCTFHDSKYMNKGADDKYSYTIPTFVNRVAITRSKAISDRIVVNHSIKTAKHVITEEALKNVENVIDDALENNENSYVKPKNTTFFELSNNLIDPAETVDGYIVNQTNGQFNSSSDHTRTGYIPVDAGAKYVLTQETGAGQFRYAFYDEQKTFISGAQMNGSDEIITIPNNASFIALSIGNHTPAKWMLKKYTDNVNFEPFDQAFVKPEHTAKIEELVMNVPSKFYALVGYECNIYFENLVEHWDQYSWRVKCAKGMQLERGFRITPVSTDVGQYPISFKAWRGSFEFTKTATLIVSDEDARSGESDDVMILGDSTTNNGIAVTKLNLNLQDDVYSISTIGTRGTAPNNHEGRSGWTFAKYFDVPNAGDIAAGVENPWYNPTSKTFDADYYFTQTGIAKPDWFFINLGINDTFNYVKDESLYDAIETIKGYCDAMIASMNSASENTKIGICLTIPPNHSQDAFGKAYRCDASRDRYKRTNVIFVNFLIKEYDNREDEGIYIIPIHASLDTVYNMGLETMPVNARNTSVTYESPIQNGGVHPVDSGYWQIADVYTAFLKAQTNT